MSLSLLLSPQNHPCGRCTLYKEMLKIQKSALIKKEVVHFPKSLNIDDQKAMRASMYQALWAQYNQDADNCIERIATGGETWVQKLRLTSTTQKPTNKVNRRLALVKYKTSLRPVKS